MDEMSAETVKHNTKILETKTCTFVTTSHMHARHSGNSLDELHGMALLKEKRPFEQGHR